MFSLGDLGGSGPNFVPEADDQQYLLTEFAQVIQDTAPHSGPQRPWIMAPTRVPPDLDGFFDMICQLQAQVGQGQLDLTVLPITDDMDEIPSDYQALANNQGQFMQTLFGRDEYVLCFSPALFKETKLLLASIARELGRIALHQHRVAIPSSMGNHPVPVGSSSAPLGSTRAELAAFALGMGVFVTNGSYIFENGCCGGGCGLNLRSVKTGLSMPQAAFLLAVDTIRRGQKRRAIAKTLVPTQKAAFSDNFKTLERRGIKSASALSLDAAATVAIGS